MSSTYRWMAPELLDNAPPPTSSATDVYAFTMTSLVRIISRLVCQFWIWIYRMCDTGNLHEERALCRCSYCFGSGSNSTEPSAGSSRWSSRCTLGFVEWRMESGPSEAPGYAELFEAFGRDGVDIFPLMALQPRLHAKSLELSGRWWKVSDMYM